MPHWWRRVTFVTWMRVLCSPIIELHATVVVCRDRTLYDMRITGQTIYLEKALNDRFDPINRDIWIENLADLTQLYLYNKIELRPPLYLYNKWNNTVAYTIGQYATMNGVVFRCIIAHTNQFPSILSGYWEYHADVVILRNKAETLQPTDFIVWVPIALVFDMSEMKALVNRYKQASKRYKILTY